MIHQFVAKLAEGENGMKTAAFVERLYGRATDSTCSSRDGDLFVAFDREADSLESALRTAIADIVAAGGTVASIEIEREEIQWLEA